MFNVGDRLKPISLFYGGSMEKKVVCYSVDKENVARKYLKPYTERVWIAATDLKDVVDNMEENTTIHEFNVADEGEADEYSGYRFIHSDSYSFYRDNFSNIVRELKHIISNDSCMTFVDYDSWDAEDVYNKPQIVELNCKMYKMMGYSMLSKTDILEIVEHVKDSDIEQALISTSGLKYTKDRVSCYKNMGVNIARVGTKAFNVDGVTFKAINQELHVAYIDKGRASKAKRRKKLDEQTIKEAYTNAAEYLLNTLYNDNIKILGNIINAYYESQLPKGLTLATNSIHIKSPSNYTQVPEVPYDYITKRVVTIIRSLFKCGVSELLMRVIKTNKYNMRKQVLEHLVSGMLIPNNLAVNTGLQLYDVLDIKDERYKFLKYTWLAHEYAWNWINKALKPMSQAKRLEALYPYYDCNSIACFGNYWSWSTHATLKESGMPEGVVTVDDTAEMLCEQFEKPLALEYAPSKKGKKEKK
jgi:hypothetical protein